MTGEYDIRFAENDAASGWEILAKQAAGNLRRAYEAIRSAPRPPHPTERQHRLRRELAAGTVKGRVMEQWQYEVTGAGRIWYLIDDETQTVWITAAGAAHPKAPD